MNEPVTMSEAEWRGRGGLPAAPEALGVKMGTANAGARLPQQRLGGPMTKKRHFDRNVAGSACRLRTLRGWMRSA